MVYSTYYSLQGRNTGFVTFLLSPHFPPTSHSSSQGLMGQASYPPNFACQRRGAYYILHLHLESTHPLYPSPPPPLVSGFSSNLIRGVKEVFFLPFPHLREPRKTLRGSRCPPPWSSVIPLSQSKSDAGNRSFSPSTRGRPVSIASQVGIVERNELGSASQTRLGE